MIITYLKSEWSNSVNYIYILFLYVYFQKKNIHSLSIRMLKIKTFIFLLN